MGPDSPASAMQHMAFAGDPPVFSLENKRVYREKMEAWIELVAQRATVDRAFKGVCSGLALVVIGSLPQSQQEMVSAAVSRGDIIKKHPSFEMQLRAVQQIMCLVAEDSPLDKVNRVAQAFRNVSKCSRSKGESLKKYAIRFKGLSELYLRVSGATQKDAAGMVLALSFLENANLQPETRNQVQLQLSRGEEMDAKPLSEHKFLGDNYKEIDEYARAHPAQATLDYDEDEILNEGVGVLAAHVLAARRGMFERKRNDALYRVPDNLFSLRDSESDATAPIFTVDQVYLVFSRMPELKESHDDHVTTKQMRSYMATIQKQTVGAGQNQISTPGAGFSSHHGGIKKRSHDDVRGDFECGRCFSMDHVWDDCPMKKSKCDSCGKIGHESWICFRTATAIDVSDKSSRLKWGRERAEAKGLRAVGITGLEAASTFAESAGIPFELKPPVNQRLHGFGPDGGQGGQTIAVWNCCVEDLDGVEAIFQFDIIMGNAPLLLGLDYDKNANTSSLESSPTWKVRVNGKEYTFGVYIARDSTSNYRRFVEFQAAPRSLIALMSRSQRNQGAVKVARMHPNRFAMRLHGWSHLPLEQMRRLARQASILTPEVDQELVKVVERCDVCPLTGSNVGSAGLRRISLTKQVHPEGNRMLQLDHVSHVVSMKPKPRERLCLSMVCSSTGYGETPPVANHSLAVAAAAVELTWLLRHGAPEAMCADPGLGGKLMESFCEQHSILCEPRPPRRHNTIGVVERRNGVMRMILERLVVGNDSLTEKKRTEDHVLLERANFLANVILGDSTLSCFQLLKGYQPSLVGLPATELSHDNVRAHLQISATRALSRLMRSKSFQPYQKPVLKVGQKIYVHTQRHTGSSRGAVGWAVHHVCRVDENMVASYPVGREKGKMNLTSFADVRVPPEDPLAQAAFEFALHQPIPQVGRWDDDVMTGKGDAEVPVADEAATKIYEPPPPGLSQPEAVATDSLLLSTVTAFYSRIEVSAITRESNDIGDVSKDIGTMKHTYSDEMTSRLSACDKQAFCNEILSCHGRENVTRQKLGFVPPWYLDHALEDELKGWDKHITMEPLQRGAVRKNVIGSHVLYCVKSHENGEHYLKARLVIHGNEEQEKENLRSDASSLHFTLIRVILSMAVCLGFHIGGVDVSKAYHQSGGPPREIRVRPPAECMLHRVVWLLLSLPYGLVDAGRQWQLAMETWLLDVMGFVTFGGLPQVFAKLDVNGAMILLIGKVSDDILVAGKEKDIEAFFSELHERWDIGKSLVSDNLLFNGARILRDNASGDIELDMTEYLNERVELLPLSRERRKQQESRATTEEVKAYRSLAGTLNFIGTGALPEASFVASVFLQRQTALLVHDIAMGNRLVSALKDLKPLVKFVTPPAQVTKMTVLGFSDASFNVIGGSSYGQSGYISGLLFESRSTQIFHVYDWYSSKQRRVVYSSFGAEILACADADNRLYGLKMGLLALLEEELVSEMLVDSKGLFTCITTLSDQREYRLRRTIARIRESFDAEELNGMRWISGILNLADAVTKWNPATWRLLQEVLNSGELPEAVVRGEVRGDQPSWRRNLPARLTSGLH